MPKSDSSLCDPQGTWHRCAVSARLYLSGEECETLCDLMGIEYECLYALLWDMNEVHRMAEAIRHDRTLTGKESSPYPDRVFAVERIGRAIMDLDRGALCTAWGRHKL